MKKIPVKKRVPVCYWHFVGWSCISFGATVCFYSPNIEIHLPFGFFRVGMQIREYEYIPTMLESMVDDILIRLQGIEKFLSQHRIDIELDKT